MEHWVERGPLRVEPRVAGWIERQAAPAAGLRAEEIWEGLSTLAARFNLRAAHLIAARAARQSAVDSWHAVAPRRAQAAREDWLGHLERIGWLLPEPAPMPMAPEGLPDEVAGRVAPHLVAALSDADAVTAAMAARWVDLPALLDTRDEGECLRRQGELLDRAVPLAGGRWADIDRLEAGDDGLRAGVPGTMAPLAQPEQWIGTLHDGAEVLRSGDLHLIVSRPKPGRRGPGGVQVEVAQSVRLEMEGWAVLFDAGARVAAWKRFAEAIAMPDAGLPYAAADGRPGVLPARPAVTGGVAGLCDTMALAEDGDGRPIAPVIFDMVALALGARAAGADERRALLLCLPELDGPEEVMFAAELAEAVEALLGLRERYLLLGLVALRRRTEANLGACIAAARGRLGHLGLGGAAALSDALRLHREAGPMPAPEALAAAPWAEATEAWRRANANSFGLIGKAQVAGNGQGLSPLARDLREAGTLTLSELARTGQSIAVPAFPAKRADILGPVLAERGGLGSAHGVAARRLLAHAAAWVGEGTGRAEVTNADGSREVLCPARARAEALWLVNQLRHGELDAPALLRLLRREAAALDAAAAMAGRREPFGPDCASHAFQAACDLVFREGDWPVGDALAVLRDRRAETMALR